MSAVQIKYQTHASPARDQSPAIWITVTELEDRGSDTLNALRTGSKIYSRSRCRDHRRSRSKSMVGIASLIPEPPLRGCPGLHSLPFVGAGYIGGFDEGLASCQANSRVPSGGGAGVRLRASYDIGSRLNYLLQRRERGPLGTADRALRRAAIGGRYRRQRAARSLPVTEFGKPNRR